MVKELEMLAPAARLRWILILAATLLCPKLADASITFRIGVSSNFLVVDGRLYFTQVDGSVTCLNLETGQVLGRSSANDYSGTIDSTAHGILLRGYDKVALIDPITLSMRWEAREAYGAALDGEALITEDGNGAVERRSLASGQVLWTYHLPGALVTAVHGNHVLVHRQGRYQGSGQPTLSLLDLASGAERFRIHPPPGQQFEEAFLAGDRVYVAAGPIDEYGGADIDCLLVLDLSGHQLATRDLPPDLLNQDRDWRGAATINGIRFVDGRPSADGPDVAFDAVSGRRTTNFGESRVSVEPLAVGDDRPLITMHVGGQARWRGVLPYLRSHFDVSRMAMWDDCILLGTAEGHVECIDALTGHSQWIYVFPADTKVLSYTSPNGLPPYLDELMKAHRTFREKQNVLRGLCVLPADAVEKVDLDALIQRAPFVRTVFDPSPIDPYAHVPALRWKAWTAVLVGATGLILIGAVLLPARRHGLCLVVALGVMGTLPVWLFSYGRVSFLPTQFTKLVILACAGIALLSAWACIRRGTRVLPSLTVLALVAWLFYLRNLFLYA